MTPSDPPSDASGRSAEPRGRARRLIGSRPARGRSPLDELGLGTAAFQRRLTIVAVLAVLALTAAACWLVWRQYDNARTSAVNDLQTRVVPIGTLIDAYFGGQVTALSAIAAAPVVTKRDSAAISAYLSRIQHSGDSPFTGSLSWIDPTGTVRAQGSARPPGSGPPLNLASRIYFRKVMTTDRPYISGGLVGKVSKRSLVIAAVPTHDAQGRLTGVLAGSLRVRALAQNKTTLNLGYQGLQLIDRQGKRLLSDLSDVQNTALLRDVNAQSNGVVTGTMGFDGQPNDVVAFTKARVPDWTVAIERSEASLYSPAKRTFVTELASVIVAALAILGAIIVAVIRTRRGQSRRSARARVWSDLAMNLGPLTTPESVANVAAGLLAVEFAGRVAVVSFAAPSGTSATAAAIPPWPEITESPDATATIASFAREKPVMIRVGSRDPLFASFAGPKRRVRSLVGLPLYDSAGEVIGTLSIVSESESLPSEDDDQFITSYAQQVAQALERTRLAAREHELAIRLQQSLLPELLPAVEGATLAGHYQAGGTGVQVGGDWYDAVRRPDGVLHLCLGDVGGRGVQAAVIMGRFRSAFHAYAHDYASPAEVLRRMLRHGQGDELIVTVAVVTFDPFGGTLTYASAGHPPTLLVDDATRQVVRFDAAGAPPIGVCEARDIVEVSLAAPATSHVALYSDGLIERRGLDIDVGIDTFGEILAADPEAPITAILGQVAERLGAADDDVALLIVGLDAAPTHLEIEIPAEASGLAVMRARLRAWLVRAKVAQNDAEDIILSVSEALNNAIEHGYGEAEVPGTVSISITDDGDTIAFTVEDQGGWRERSPNSDGGRGLGIMERLMTELTVDRSDTGTRVTLRKRINPREGRGLLVGAPGQQ